MYMCISYKCVYVYVRSYKTNSSETAVYSIYL